MSNELNQVEVHEIFDLLPHRFPFLLVDRVLDYKAGEWAHAIKCITVNEPIFTGHFPGRPIFPGVLILEALAQASGILGYKTVQKPQNSNELYLLASFDNVKFKRPVTPGDTLHLHVKFLKERRGMWKFYGEAKVDGEIVCTADLMCARREM